MNVTAETKTVDVRAVLAMALLYVEETHEIHPGDFKPGVAKRNIGDLKKSIAAITELLEAVSERHEKADVVILNWITDGKGEPGNVWWPRRRAELQAQGYDMVSEWPDGSEEFHLLGLGERVEAALRACGGGK